MRKDVYAQAKELDDLHRLAREFGLTPAETGRIFDAVHAKAQASAAWGSVEERLAEIRQRIHLARK